MEELDIFSCVICLGDFENEIVRLKCNAKHIFHEECIK